MKLHVFFGIVLFLQTTGWSQDNLVANGSFDDSLICPGNSTIAHWFVPQNNPVDIDNLCPYIDWWRFIRDPKMGIQGSQCGFIETFYKGFADDNIYSGRLYLATKLLHPLQANRKYYFEMMVRAVDTFPNFKLVNTVFTNGQDVSFVKELPLFDFDLPRNFLPFKPEVTNILHSDYEWHKVSHCFVATGNERFLIIGNFKNDANTETSTTGKRNSNFPNGLIANYAIDNVVLTPMDITLTDTSFCKKDTLVLNLFKSAPRDIAYRWQDGSTAPQYATAKSETIQINMRYSDQCVEEKQIYAMALSPLGSDVSLTKDTFLCEGQSMVLSGGIHIAGQSIQWENGSKALDRVISGPGTYTSTIENNCPLKITQKIQVKLKECNTGIFVPNAFTPNGDGLNDEFKPRFDVDFPEIESVELSIFNRWGQLVYFSRERDAGWDGLYRSRHVPAGVYLYQLKIKTTKLTIQNVIVRQGDLTLIR